MSEEAPKFTEQYINLLLFKYDNDPNFSTKDFTEALNYSLKVHYEPIVVEIQPESKRRLKKCVDNWAECETGQYNPYCCRFPKSCSASVYSDEYVTEDDLEPA